MCTSLLGSLAALLLAVGCFAQQPSNAKKKVSSESGLQRFTYPVKGATTSEDGRRHLIDEKRSVELLQQRAQR